MLSISSLRRITHSTTLRATGSLMDCLSSPACGDLPFRTAAIASLTALRSAGDVEEVGATGSDGAGLALPLALPAAFPVALPGADFVLLAAVLAAAFSFGGALSLTLSLSFA